MRKYLFLLLIACTSAEAARRAQPPPPPPAATTPAAAAARAAAGSVCKRSSPFYWEIGDKSAVLASGTIGPKAPARDTPLKIASASKMIYGAYVVEKGYVAERDRQYMNLRSGYEKSPIVCRPTQTISSCAGGAAAVRTDKDTGKIFAYGGAHMQEHAANVFGLGGLSREAFGVEVSKVLGVHVEYEMAQPAGGAVISAAEYAKLMQRAMRGELKFGAALGTDAVCTEPGSCKTATRSPVPVAWSYSIGHWVESPAGDGAFSSPGAFGFYPWIDRTKTYYGMVARGGKPAAWQSAKCGAAIRQAFLGN